MRRLVLIASLLTLSACSGTGVVAPSSTPASVVSDTPEPIETPDASPEEISEDTPEPTPVAVSTTTYKPGELISVTQDGSPWATIVVDKVKVVTKYEGGYFDDTPKKGNVYIQARVTYTAEANGVDYNPYDWQIFVSDLAVENTTFVSNGPEPSLSSGTLPKGRKASGYVVYEVPKSGRVVMSYGENMFSDKPPVFEVVIRAK